MFEGDYWFHEKGYIICVTFINPILDGVRDTPIMDGGCKKGPKVNSTIWGLTTMKIGGNRVWTKNFPKQPKEIVTS